MYPLTKKIVTISFVFFALLAPQVLLAAQVTILPEQKAVIQNAEFQTDITVDTKGESINVFSGTIVFPKDIVELKEIRTGNSIINLWVESPKEVDGKIRFAGAIPGGYVGTKGVLFSLIFTATNQGKGSIAIEEPLFLKNDGKGTEAKISISGSALEVLGPDVRRDIVIPPISDTTPPEMFIPEISQTPTLYNDSWFLVFLAQDKGSGIDHYEVQEHARGLFSFFAPWVRATSPYLLKDQSVDQVVAVRAVDKAGNIRTAYAKAPHSIAWYASLTNWFIIISILVIAGLITQPLRKLWRK